MPPPPSQQLDCLRAQDLHHWVELLPTDYVTFLIDCHQSHVVAYGKLKQVGGVCMGINITA